MTKLIEDRQEQEFRDNGVTILRGVFSDWVKTLQDGTTQNMDDPGPTARIYKGDEGGGRFFSDFCNWDRISDYKDFILNSTAAQIGAELMDSKRAQLFHEHVLVKEAQAGVPTPWHQDAPYYCVDGPKTVSIWIPLDVVPRETTLEFVSGSHKWGKFYRPQRFDGTALNEDDGLENIPNIDDHRDDFDIVGWDMKPGDAVAFDYRTIHGAPANTSSTSQRRAFSLRLVGDNARFVRRDGIVTSPPFPNVALENNAPLGGDEFPILYGQ